MSGLEVWWRKFAKSYQLKGLDVDNYNPRITYTVKLASISQRKLGVKRVIVHYPEKWSCEKELTWDEAKALAIAVIRLSGKQIILKGYRNENRQPQRQGDAGQADHAEDQPPQA